MNKIEAYTKKVCRTKETARQALIDMGLYTKGGQLHENYGGPTLDIPEMPD